MRARAFLLVCGLFPLTLGSCAPPTSNIHGDQTAIGAVVLLDGARVGVLAPNASHQSCGAGVRIPKGDRRLTFVSVRGESASVAFNSTYNTPLFVTFRGHDGKPEVYFEPEVGR
jgi:hypothetical protein